MTTTRLLIALVAIQLLVVSFSHALSPNAAGQASRRAFVENSMASAALGFVAWQGLPANAAAADKAAFEGFLSQIQRARQQMDSVPALIDAEKWDSVRAVLVEPPLADCWAKTSRPLLSKYAESLGDSGGDELAALEAKEELVSHLRYLDMAVYNNNFNPITVEGKNGATKELIRSYYEDPMNEYKASIAALNDLIKLASETGS
ncbi:unnamed protein product [Cylindrotheca closterium]|uniref:Uncharacterized protein n=1 Tax=Cylindrotheca closterium TaxID=2856 RepID=A0AAD2G8I5_9STRA|nr:unnamed protein product [Cylindrotheca closterium]